VQRGILLRTEKIEDYNPVAWLVLSKTGLRNPSLTAPASTRLAVHSQETKLKQYLVTGKSFRSFSLILAAELDEPVSSIEPRRQFRS
jgi:hypothetical protein